MTRVRTTIKPEEVLEVDATELGALRHQGLLLEEVPTPDPVPAKIRRDNQNQEVA